MEKIFTKKNAVLNNSGIIVTGGTLQAKAVAAGDNARANYREQSVSSDTQKENMQEFLSRMDELIALVRKEPGCANTGMDNALETAKKELSSQTPNKFLVTSVLEMVATHAKSVTTIMGCLEGLRKLVTVVF